MTVKKAIEILERYSKQKVDVKNGLQDPTKSWNTSNDLSKQIAEMISDYISTDIEVLADILKQIKPDCKHPKKMIDTCNGQKYCMSCNLDL